MLVRVLSAGVLIAAAFQLVPGLFRTPRSADSWPGPGGVDMLCWELAHDPCWERAEAVAAIYNRRTGVPRASWWEINVDTGRDLVCLTRGLVDLCFLPDARVPSPEDFQPWSTDPHP